MANIHNQQGNALVTTLSMICCGIALVILVAWFMYPYNAIDGKRINQLQSMIEESKGTAFDSEFKKRINYDLSDGKISNKEFNNLVETFNGYKTAKITGNESDFIKMTQTNLENQYQADAQAKVMNKYLYMILSGIGVFVIGLIGWKRITGDL